MPYLKDLATSRPSRPRLLRMSAADAIRLVDKRLGQVGFLRAAAAHRCQHWNPDKPLAATQCHSISLWDQFAVNHEGSGDMGETHTPYQSSQLLSAWAACSLT